MSNIMFGSAKNVSKTATQKTRVVVCMILQLYKTTTRRNVRTRTNTFTLMFNKNNSRYHEVPKLLGTSKVDRLVEEIFFDFKTWQNDTHLYHNNDVAGSKSFQTHGAIADGPQIANSYNYKTANIFSTRRSPTTWISAILERDVSPVHWHLTPVKSGYRIDRKFSIVRKTMVHKHGNENFIIGRFW